MKRYRLQSQRVPYGYDVGMAEDDAGSYVRYEEVAALLAQESQAAPQDRSDKGPCGSGQFDSGSPASAAPDSGGRGGAGLAPNPNDTGGCGTPAAPDSGGMPKEPDFNQEVNLHPDEIASRFEAEQADVQAFTPTERSFEDTLDSAAQFVMDCYSDFSEAEARVIAKKLREAAERLRAYALSLRECVGQMTDQKAIELLRGLAERHGWLRDDLACDCEWHIKARDFLAAQDQNAEPDSGGMPEEPHDVQLAKKVVANKLVDPENLLEATVAYINELRAYALSRCEKREGWELAPKRPTPKMLDAAIECFTACESDATLLAKLRIVYHAMLSAAPREGERADHDCVPKHGVHK